MSLLPSLAYFVDSSGVTWSLNVNLDGSLTTSVVTGSTTIPASGIYETTAGDIINSCNADSQFRVNNQQVLLDYVNRVHQRILRESAWQFLLSRPQRFITEPGATQYWIAAGATPAGCSNTGLALTDLWSVPNEHVFDGSNWAQLQPVSKSILNSPNYTFQDTSPRADRPRTFNYDITNPGVLNNYPAPDNQNVYQPVPLPPLCTVSPGGALPNRIYYVNTTFVDDLGNEGTASNQATLIFVTAGKLLTVNQPEPEVASATSVTYSSYNIYVGLATNQPPEVSSTNVTLQASGFTGPWTEPTTGITNTGPLPPGDSMLIPLYGYVIEFRYTVQRQVISTIADILQVPTIYMDVVVAGVNWFVSMFLDNTAQPQDFPGRAMTWKEEFQEGLKGIRRDLNLNFRKSDYISPDLVSQSQNTGIKLDYPSLGL